MWSRRVPIALVMVGLSACGGGGGDGGGTGPGDHPGISISVSTTALSVQAGGTATMTVTVTRTGGASSTISLAAEGLPSYMTGSFSPATLSGATTTSTLTVTADPAVTPGTYRFSVRASASGVSDAVSPAIDCTVAAAPGFTLAATGSAISVIQGASGTVGIGIARTGGFTGAVTLALEGAPAGVTGSFQPNPAAEAQSTLTVSVLATAAAGSYPLTIRGNGTGVPVRTTTVTLTVLDAATAGFTLSLDPGSLAIAKGGTGTVTVTVARTGGFTGPVALFSEGQPAGVTPTFDESPVTGTTSHLLLTVSNQVPAGTYPMTIRGEVAGLTTRRVGLELRVDEALGFTLALSQALVTLAPGSSPQVVTVQITRTGSFAGEVALSATGLPPNVTASFAPQSTTGNTSLLTLTALAGANPGASTITVHGTSIGIAEQTATLALNVVAAGTSMTWRFCGPNQAPVFFAYQDGVSAFVAVPAAGDGSYPMALASGKGAVVFVQPGLPEPPAAPSFRTIGRSPRAAPPSGYTTTVLYATTAELQALSQAQCPASVTTKTVSGTVATVVGDMYLVALGGSIAINTASVLSYQLTDVLDGVHDLVAGSARVVGDGAEPTRVILRRDQNPANGSNLPLLDFGSGEAFVPVSASLNLTGLASGTSTEVGLGFTTANGTTTLIGALESQTATSRTWFGIPTPRLRAGDLHYLVATASLQGPTRERSAMLVSREVGSRTIGFAPEAPVPSVGVHATTPVVRLRAGGSCGASGSALSGLTTATFTQSDRAWILSETSGYLGASPNYELRTLVLTNLQGWNESLFGVMSGAEVQWYLECNGEGLGFVPADGSLVQWLIFRGMLMP